MKRRQFIRLFSLLGLSLPSSTLLTGCGANTTTGDSDNGTSKSVLIIGAGAAGLAAGHLLKQRGINFQILEASSSYGGRMKQTTTFTDFPIPLGAEWLHVDKSEFSRIVNDSSVNITTRTQNYSPQDSVGLFEAGELSVDTLENTFGEFEDRKFIGSSWFDFFDTYIVPGIKENIKLDSPVVLVNYQEDKVQVTDANSHLYEADQVIITAPINILRDGDINFVPVLPVEKLSALEEAPVWGGIKVFMEFSEDFYPTFLGFPDSETNIGQRLYYDAAYAQNTSRNILGLFAVGEQAKPYQALSGDARRDYILEELDSVFEGAASRTYIKHQVQNWNDEPYIRAAYLADNAPGRIPGVLAEPLNDKVFFAGDAYTQGDDWGGVHNAAQAARDVVEKMSITKISGY